MEYQKIVNLLDNIPSQSSKFRTKIGLKNYVIIVMNIYFLKEL